MTTQIKDLNIDVVYFNTLCVFVFGWVKLSDSSGGQESQQSRFSWVVQTKENNAGILFKESQSLKHVSKEVNNCVHILYILFLFFI